MFFSRFGFSTWFFQRFFAFILIFLVLISYYITLSEEMYSFGFEILSLYPFYIISFLFIMLCHGIIGIKVIACDYINSTILRKIILCMFYTLSLLTILFLLSVMVSMFFVKFIINL